MKNPLRFRELPVGLPPSDVPNFVRSKQHCESLNYRVTSWGPNTGKYVITDLIWGGQYAVRTSVEETPLEDAIMETMTCIIETTASDNFPGRVPPPEREVVGRMIVTYSRKRIPCIGNGPDFNVGEGVGRTVTEIDVGAGKLHSLYHDIFDFLNPAGRL